MTTTEITKDLSNKLVESCKELDLNHLNIFPENMVNILLPNIFSKYFTEEDVPKVINLSEDEALKFNNFCERVNDFSDEALLRYLHMKLVVRGKSSSYKSSLNGRGVLSFFMSNNLRPVVVWRSSLKKDKESSLLNKLKAYADFNLISMLVTTFEEIEEEEVSYNFDYTEISLPEIISSANSLMVKSIIHQEKDVKEGILKVWKEYLDIIKASKVVNEVCKEIPSAILLLSDIIFNAGTLFRRNKENSNPRTYFRFLERKAAEILKQL